MDLAFGKKFVLALEVLVAGKKVTPNPQRPTHGLYMRMEGKWTLLARGLPAGLSHTLSCLRDPARPVEDYEIRQLRGAKSNTNRDACFLYPVALASRTPPVDSLRVLQSTLDKSVNFVEAQLEGFLESRYVRKCDKYFVCYLSSQTGCNRGCAFCHLTVTDQTAFTDSSQNDFLGQALQVFKHYRQAGTPAQYMHYSFMARGEPLASRVIVESADELLPKLWHMAKDAGLPAKFNLSTIVPRTLKRSLVEIFSLITPTIYYSLYGVDEAFRAKWIPGAMPVSEALLLLKEYQDFSKKIIKIHHAFIAGVNDSDAQVETMCDAIDAAGLVCDFNLVRYNPASSEQGVESDAMTLGLCMRRIKNRFKGKVQVIQRVGFDVKASCGMFV